MSHHEMTNIEASASVTIEASTSFASIIETTVAPVAVEETATKKRGRPASGKGKGKEPAVAKQGRKAHFSVSEDIQIFTSWKEISLDATVGTDQSRETYWQRIYAHFALHQEGTTRSQSSIESRWRDIQARVFKFCGCLEQARAHKASGESEHDTIIKAMELLEMTVKDKNKKKFDMLHCYQKLKSMPKWKALMADSAAGNQPRRAPAQPTLHAAAADTDADDYSIAIEKSGDDDELPRPVGRKKAKILQREKLANDKAAKAIAERQEKILENQERRFKQLEEYLLLQRLQHGEKMEMERMKMQLEREKWEFEKSRRLATTPSTEYINLDDCNNEE